MVDRHIFILNPAAGKRDCTESLSAQIVSTMGARGLPYEIYRTQYPEHATALVNGLLRESPGKLCRFYACGGDGTLREVAAGAAGHPGAQVACYPCGTGNDFIKLFSGREYFLDIGRLADGEPIPLDYMTCSGLFALNLCSAGFDARVARWVGENKRRMPFGGSFPFVVAVCLQYFGKISRRYRVSIDGEMLDGDYSILVASSGRYYGGGFYALPEAEPDDGLLDFLLVRRVGHLNFIRCIFQYARGRHELLGPLAVYRRGRRIVFESDAPEPINIDGEISVMNRAEIAAASGKLPFVLPAGAVLLRHSGYRSEEKGEMMRFLQ